MQQNSSWSATYSWIPFRVILLFAKLIHFRIITITLHFCIVIVMKYREFEQIFGTYQVFTTQDIFLVDDTFALNQLTRWQHDGYITKLRRWKWVFTALLKNLRVYPRIANFLVSHSYLSLEWALSWYGILPESVPVYTSICSHRKEEYAVNGIQCTYQKIKPSLYFGYEIVKYGDTYVAIGFLEKVLLDYFYIHPWIHTEDDFESMRFNTYEINERILWERFDLYSTLYPKTVQSTVSLFIARVQKDA